MKKCFRYHEHRPADRYPNPLKLIWTGQVFATSSRLEDNITRRRFANDVLQRISRTWAAKASGICMYPPLSPQ
eukprot:8347760-Karenia_brevis.AAC.1